MFELSFINKIQLLLIGFLLIDIVFFNLHLVFSISNKKHYYGVVIWGAIAFAIVTTQIVMALPSIVRFLG